jgi:hypothetical protein
MCSSGCTGSGTGRPPRARVSGLEEEFELSGGLPRLLYVKAPAPDRESGLASLLARIEQEASASYRHFRTPAELGQLVRDDLAVLLSERFTASGAAPPAPAQPLPPSGPRGPGRLPVSTTSLIGRERVTGSSGMHQMPRLSAGLCAILSRRPVTQRRSQSSR